MTSTDPAHQERGGATNCRECNEALEPDDVWFHEPCTGMDEAAVEIRSLRADIAAAQAGRTECERQFQAKVATIIELMDQLDDLKAQLAERDAQLSALLERSRREVKVIDDWREYWIHDSHCAECRRVRPLGQACREQFERFESMWKATLTALDSQAQPGEEGRQKE